MNITDNFIIQMSYFYNFKYFSMVFEPCVELSDYDTKFRFKEISKRSICPLLPKNENIIIYGRNQKII